MSTGTRRASPLIARIVLASMLSSLPGTQAWSQTKGGAVAIGHSSLGILSPSPVVSQTVSPVNLLPSALPNQSALPAPSIAPLASVKPIATVPSVGAYRAAPAVESLINAAGKKSNVVYRGSNSGRHFDGSGTRGAADDGSDDGSQSKAVAIWTPPTQAPILVQPKIYFPGVNPQRVAIGKDILANVMRLGGHMIVASPNTSEGGLNDVGVLVQLSQSDGSSAVMTVKSAVTITGYTKSNDVEMAQVIYPPADQSDKDVLNSLAVKAQHTLERYAYDPQFDKDFLEEATFENDPKRLTNLLSQELSFTNEVKLDLLKQPSTEKRLRYVISAMESGLEQPKTASYVFNDQNTAAASSDNLAPVDHLASLAALNARMTAIGMPERVRKTARAEFDNLARLNPKDGDAQKLRTYIQWLLDVPWSQRTEDNLDTAKAERILNEEHFGLVEIKERILDLMAVRKKTGSKKGIIVTLTGPPGTGKTTIAKSIAKAFGRKFVRISLGGVHDETVLRGHGRTYQGSLPGQIIDKMKEAGTVNPVMLLDEVDKIGREGNAGDPTAALLEILDPNQNDTFRDQYLNVPYDLSEVIFIVTSNEIDKVPAPLRDRSEIIELDGYTTLEKMEIAKRHIIPQQLAETGLKPEEASLTKDALRLIIEGYTLEAGVRGLTQEIGEVMRKISSWIERRGEAVPGIVDAGMIAKYLGIERYTPGQLAQNGIGVATGLYVSGNGGGALNVEASQRPGTGKLTRRQAFGKDIDDSALTAYEHVVLNAEKYGLGEVDFQKVDVDVDFTPATNIDGPSAGTLMTTAMISAITKRPIKPGLAMTGEMTKRGDILPIGGLKQKVLGAYRRGYTQVIFPFGNLKDIEDIPQEVRDAVKLTPVKTYDEIFAAAFVP
jgi:ATP-dependent Lon protease